MSRSVTTPPLALAFALLAACGGSTPEPEPPAPDETDPVPAAPVDSLPGPELPPEPEPEAAPDFMAMAAEAAASGDFAEARRLYGEAATEDGVSPEQFAAAEAMIAMLYAVLPEEPDLDAIQIRLDEARRSSPETARLEVAALQRLVDAIRERDETVRRLTELIGN